MVNYVLNNTSIHHIKFNGSWVNSVVFNGQTISWSPAHSFGSWSSWTNGPWGNGTWHEAWTNTIPGQWSNWYSVNNNYHNRSKSTASINMFNSYRDNTRINSRYHICTICSYNATGYETNTMRQWYNGYNNSIGETIYESAAHSKVSNAWSEWTHGDWAQGAWTSNWNNNYQDGGYSTVWSNSENNSSYIIDWTNSSVIGDWSTNWTNASSDGPWAENWTNSHTDDPSTRITTWSNSYIDGTVTLNWYNTITNSGVQYNWTNSASNWSSWSDFNATKHTRDRTLTNQYNHHWVLTYVNMYNYYWDRVYTNIFNTSWTRTFENRYNHYKTRTFTNIYNSSQTTTYTNIYNSSWKLSYTNAYYNSGIRAYTNMYNNYRANTRINSRTRTWTCNVCGDYAYEELNTQQESVTNWGNGFANHNNTTVWNNGYSNANTITQWSNGYSNHANTTIWNNGTQTSSTLIWSNGYNNHANTVVWSNGYNNHGNTLQWSNGFNNNPVTQWNNGILTSTEYAYADHSITTTNECYLRNATYHIWYNNGQCSICGHTVQTTYYEQHTFSDWYVIDNDYHAHSCSACDYYTTAAHSKAAGEWSNVSYSPWSEGTWGAWYYYDNSLHVHYRTNSRTYSKTRPWICTLCSWENTQTQSGSEEATQTGYGGHSGTSHTDYQYRDTTTHYVNTYSVCSICGGSYGYHSSTAAHTFSGNVCTGCGYNRGGGPQPPVCT